MLQIATTKVEQIVVLARQFDVQVAPWDDASNADRENDMASNLELTEDDPAAARLKGTIDGLNEDEQASLVALMWIGRGTYDATDLEEAVSVARSEHINKTLDYLLGVPLLANYLEAGLDKLGYSEERSQPD